MVGFSGLTADSIAPARKAFKGDFAGIAAPELKEPSPSPERVVITVRTDTLGRDGFERCVALLSEELRDRLGVEPGDLVFAERPNPLWGGLKSGCYRVSGEPVAGAEAFVVGAEGAELLGVPDGSPVKIWRWM